MRKFSVDLMTQGAIQFPVHIEFKKGHLSLSPCLFVYIPLKAIQMVMKPLQFLCSMWPDDKGFIHLTEPAQRFVRSLCYGPLFNVFHKEVSDDRREGGAHRHSICLLVELASKGEICRSEDIPK